MKIAIIGYGKMGQMIEATAKQRGHTIGSVIDINDEHLMAPENMKQNDVAIEFTTPDTAFDNISKCMDAGIPVVSGSTGWTGRLEEMKIRCQKETLGFVYASNFSLGVNILFSLNDRLAGIMENHLEKQVYNALLDIMELSSVKLAKEEVAGLQKTGRLYQTIPMIVDGVAHTGENRARYISETPFIEDMLLAYAAGKVTAEDALKEVNFYADDVNGMGAKLTQPVKFDHAKMAARLAKKKNFPFLDQVKAKFPNVYEAIVTAGENKELERALSHPMYRIGVDAGIQVCEDALNQQDITKQDDLAHAVERLGQTIQKYQPMFTGGK